MIIYIDDNNNTSNQENPSHIFNDPGIYDVMLIAIDSLSCNIADTLMLEINVSSDSVDAEFSYSSLCFGDPIIFNALNATSSDDLIWDFGDGNTSSLLSPSHTYDSEGIYQVELLINSYCDAVDAVTNELEIIPPPVVSLGQDIETCNDSILIIPEIINQSGDIEYLWSDNSNLSSNYLTSGVYWLEITDELGCVASDSIYINLIPSPVGFLSGGGSVCGSETSVPLNFELTGSPPFNLLYTLNGQENFQENIVTDNFQFYTDIEGEYVFISINDATECIGTVSGQAEVIHQILPEAELTGGGLICPNDSIQLQINISGSPPFFAIINNGSYSFTLDTIYDDLTSFYVNFEGIYSIEELVDINGCQSNQLLGNPFITLKDYIDPSITTTIDSAICPVDDKILLETLNPNGKWYGSGIDLNNFFHPKVAGPGEHMLYYVMEENCNETDSILINLDCELQIYIPNTFTPNTDSWNDLFVIKSNGYLEWFELNIYNRWGEKLYFTDDINDYWNGKFKNQVVQTGVYTYLVKAFGSDGETLIKSGHVHVMH